MWLFLRQTSLSLTLYDCLGYERGIILMKEIKIYPDEVIDASVLRSIKVQRVSYYHDCVKRCQEVKYINHYHYLFCLFFLAILPFSLYLFGIRKYVLTFMVSAIYNRFIIAIYITGSLCIIHYS